MPTQHTVTSYKFEELSDRAKEKARDWYRDGALDYDWWDSTYDDASRVGLKITGFDLGGRSSLDARFERDPIEVARAIVKEHGKACETRKDAEEFLSDLEDHSAEDFALGDDGTLDTVIQCRNCGAELRYTYDRDGALEAALETESYDDFVKWAKEDAAEQHVCEPTDERAEEFLRDLCGDYWRILEKEAEYLTSDECVDESIIANEYDFTADGRRFTGA